MRLFTLRPTLAILAALALGLPMAACKDGAQDCPDVAVTDDCTLRCGRTANEGGAKKVCGKYLMLSDVGNNEILQRKTKRIETRQLPAETCYAIDAAGALTSADDRKTLEAICKSP